MSVLASIRSWWASWRRNRREDLGHPDELEHLKDKAVAGNRYPPPPTPGGL
jgi:hypothetical protein